MDDPTFVAYGDGGTFVSEEQEDLADALCPIHDQLALKWWWWIFKVIPQRRRYQRDEDDQWQSDLV